MHHLFLAKSLMIHFINCKVWSACKGPSFKSLASLLPPTAKSLSLHSSMLTLSHSLLTPIPLNKHSCLYSDCLCRTMSCSGQSLEPAPSLAVHSLELGQGARKPSGSVLQTNEGALDDFLEVTQQEPDVGLELGSPSSRTQDLKTSVK